MVAFSESATGQALVAKQPNLQAKVLPLVGELMPGFQADLKAEICARIDCTGGTATPKHSEASSPDRG